MQAKPVENAATGSPRAVRSADKLLSAAAELQRQQRQRRLQIQQQQQQQNVWKSTFPLSLQNKRAFVLSERASTEFRHVLLKVMWTGLVTFRHCNE